MIHALNSRNFKNKEPLLSGGACINYPFTLSDGSLLLKVIHGTCTSGYARKSERSKIMREDLEGILKKYSKDGLVDLEEVDELLKLINRATRESYSSGRTHGNYDIKTMLEKTLMVEEKSRTRKILDRSRFAAVDWWAKGYNCGFNMAVREHNEKVAELLKGLE